MLVPHVRGASLSTYAEVAREVGLDPVAMLRRFDIDPRALVDSDIRIPTAKVVNLLESSAADSRCPTFGLQMAELRRLTDLGVLSLLITHQPKMRDALMTLIEFRQLLSESLIVQVEEHDGLVVVRQEVLVGTSTPARQAYELAIGVVFRLFRSVLGPRWRAQSVNFSHSAPPALQVHHRVFGPIVEFDSEFNGLTCSSLDLDSPNPSADPALARFAEHYVRGLAETDGELLTHDVQRAICALLPFGQASMERVAISLGVNERTCQRRLAAEGVDFSRLLNEIRREFATRYVAEGGLPLARVADLLGYSRQSSFSRWFADEFGMPARAWRTQHSAAAAEKRG